MKKRAEEIFLAGVESVLPEILVQSHVKLDGDTLQIAGKSYRLSQFCHIYVLAAGKAAALMAKEVETILGDKISGGHVITKYGHGAELKYLPVTEAGHPIPDAHGVEGTKKMVDIALKAGENDLAICLISGGASALMADFPDDATLDDLKRANGLLVKCGADITEINTIRKHLSNVKGGQLAKALYPATTVCLILSDVVGDRLDVIASGPTVGDPTTFSEAWAVIEKYALQDSFPQTLLQHLKKGMAGFIPETPEPGDVVFEKVQNSIIGNNMLALEGASRKASELGFETHIITDKLMGDYTKVADFILGTIREYQQNPDKKHGVEIGEMSDGMIFENLHEKSDDKFGESFAQKPVCLLFGGEPTVKVTGKGLGGRNQHLALYLSTKLEGEKEITILCAGTDGTDGPTNAAGAVVDNKTTALGNKTTAFDNKTASVDNRITTVNNKLFTTGNEKDAIDKTDTITVEKKMINPQTFLQNSDSYHFFQQAGGHIITGNTRTNVMDMVVVLIPNPTS